MDHRHKHVSCCERRLRTRPSRSSSSTRLIAKTRVRTRCWTWFSICFVELKATDEQLDFPVIYASAKNGFALRELHENNEDMTPLFEAIVKHVPPPTISADPFFQMLVSNLDYSDYLGRIALGRIVSGRVNVGDSIVCIHRNGGRERATVTRFLLTPDWGRSRSNMPAPVTLSG